MTATVGMPVSAPPLAQPPFLPMSAGECRALGWDALDVLLVSGDAYLDHPACAVALLGRHLVAHGFRTGVVAQPDWRDAASLTAMGTPRLYVGVTAGALDSMLAHYTAFRKKRHDDSYTPAGRAGARPNRACIVYANLLRRAFAHTPIVLGGIEASLRRVSHYDFWSDSLRRSILLDAKADLLVYGMGERAMLDVARHCQQGMPLRGIPGTVWSARPDEAPRADGVEGGDAGHGVVRLPAHEAIAANPPLLMRATLELERQVHGGRAYAVQDVGDRCIVIAPPAQPLNTPELDALYALPYARAAHPAYTAPIPALATLRDSVTSHRGCGGGCSFCSLALHQGRAVRSRSRESILAEVRQLAHVRGFSGSISDVGGPTANMWQGRCLFPGGEGGCRRRSCCVPRPCRYFSTPQQAHVDLLRAAARVPGVRHVRVASGIRPDIIGDDLDALHAYTVEFTGGQLKVAPEHASPEVLKRMRKPPLEVFERFLAAFQRYSRDGGRRQFVVPYLMSAFPGCTEADMRLLADWLAARNWKPQQVQCFIPTPGTVATAMYYGGVDERGHPLYVARTDAERLRQHRILMPDLGRPRGSGKTGKRGKGREGGEGRHGRRGARGPAREDDHG